ncbi:hypothetical protein BAE44_0020991 [Dichanthelium oligosanthes]|uniref:Uncharacterized protein n=1 Tax=Dichanthelium oligosanthes TaxID=888268 RepID=A0A1E5UYJ4_9POAL|nr:hypothetical protein BAE44_0020991 [Dichanthelium oligosanthes]
MRAQAPTWASTVSSWCCTNNWGGARCLHRKCVKTLTCAILHGVSTSASLWLRCTSTVSDKQAQVGEGSPKYFAPHVQVEGKLEPTSPICVLTYI